MYVEQEHIKSLNVEKKIKRQIKNRTPVFNQKLIAFNTK